jgi:hypothetical protein
MSRLNKRNTHLAWLGWIIVFALAAYAVVVALNFAPKGIY